MIQEKAKSPRTSNSRQHPATAPQVEIICSASVLQCHAPLKSSELVSEFVRSLYDPRKISYKEFFYAVLLNGQMECIGHSQIGVGATSCVVVNVKEIFQLALLSNATGLILSHNHPSGRLNPSKEDIAYTDKIKAGAALFDIKLYDHIIITAEGYYSFSDEGLI